MNLTIPKSDSERRSTVRLAQYWNQIRGEAELPSEEQIDPDQLIGLWERCFLIQLRDLREVKDYNYTYLGSDLLQAYEDGRLERGNGQMAEPDATKIEGHFSKVLFEKGPVMDEAEYQDSHGRNVKYRQIFMPIGENDDEIHSIFGSAWFRLD